MDDHQRVDHVHAEHPRKTLESLSIYEMQKSTSIIFRRPTADASNWQCEFVWTSNILLKVRILHWFFSDFWDWPNDPAINLIQDYCLTRSTQMILSNQTKFYRVFIKQLTQTQRIFHPTLPCTHPGPVRFSPIPINRTTIKNNYDSSSIDSDALFSYPSFRGLKYSTRPIPTHISLNSSTHITGSRHLHVRISMLLSIILPWANQKINNPLTQSQYISQPGRHIRVRGNLIESDVGDGRITTRETKGPEVQTTVSAKNRNCTVFTWFSDSVTFQFHK